jgi:hypothetical protein
MTDASAPLATSSPSGRSTSLAARARETIAAHPTATALGLYSIVALAAVAAAYFAIFTQFAPYDDEGTLLVSLKAFSHGQALYGDVYSPYGPFYYELFGGFFALTGLAVSNDASRLIVIAVWVGASCMYGVSAQRLSGRLLLGVTAMIVAFAVLGVLVNEPMHPQGLCVLLLAGLTLLLAVGSPRRFALAGCGAGALLAALILTKVNLGGLAIAAIGLAAVLTIEPLYRRRWLRWPVIAAFLVLPTLLMARELRADWVRELIAIELLASLALLVAARSLRPARGEADQGMMRWAAGAAAGFAAAFVVIIGALLLSGSSLGDLYDGAVVQGFKIGDVFVIPFSSPTAAADWGIAALAAAILVLRLRPPGGADSLWPGLLRILAGLVIWLTVARAAPFSLGPSSNQEALPLVLAWVAVIPPIGSEGPPYRRFMRVALAALCLTETLQVYPVAGSQVGIAAVSFVAVGAICLGDGLQLLRAWSAARGPQALERFALVTAVLILALGGKMALEAIVRPAASNAILYRDQPALPFAGAGLLHPASNQVAEYSQLVDLLKAHRCTTFIGQPNSDSLYLWSGIEPPKPSAPGAWLVVLDAGEQQRVVDEMRASPRPCAIRNATAADAWLHGAPPPDTPLVRYIAGAFEPAGQVAEWEFLVPKRAQ